MRIPDYIRRAVDKPEVIVDNDYVLLSQLRQQFDDYKRNASRISFKGNRPFMSAASVVIDELSEMPFVPERAIPTKDEGLFMLFRQLQEEIEQFEQERGVQPSLEGIKQILVNHLGTEANRELTPSHLFVPKSKGIILDDFGCELSLPSLPKAVFVLFLRHPEGIVLKQRHAYYEELLAIYGKFYNKANKEEFVENCKRLVDITDGSMDQKITTINTTFKKNLTLKLAEQYQILGERGGVKSVQLDRSLVKFDKEIEDIPLTVLK